MVESGADVGQSGLILGELVTGIPSVAANRAEVDEAENGVDDFGGTGGADDGAAVVATGSRVGVGRSGIWDAAMRYGMARNRRGMSIMELIRLEMESQAAARVRDGASAQGAGSRALGLESQATVEAQHLCCPSGTDRSFGDSGCVGSVEEERQRNEAVSGGFDGAGAGNCFLGSELRMGSRMDVAQADATIGGGESGGFMGSERQQDEVASEGGGGSGGADAASCLPGPELQAESRMDVAQVVMTIDDGESGGLVGSERQQGKMAGEGDSGRFGGGMLFSGARAPGGISGGCGSGG